MDLFLKVSHSGTQASRVEPLSTSNIAATYVKILKSKQNRVVMSTQQGNLAKIRAKLI